MSYRNIAIWLAVLIYVASPFDLLPDFFGLFGRIDDLLVIILTLWWLQRHVLPPSGDETPSEKGTMPNSLLSPWKVLEIPPNSSQKEIKAAYKKLSSEYHPDKVQHLGADLQQLAHDKFIQINNAYHQLKELETADTPDQ